MIKLNVIQRGQVSRYINDQRRMDLNHQSSLRGVLIYAKRLLQLEKEKPARLIEAEKVNKRLRDAQQQDNKGALLDQLTMRNEQCIDNHGVGIY